MGTQGNIYFKSLLNRASVILFFMVCSMALLPSGLLLPGNAAAQIKTISPWPAIAPVVSNSNTGTISGKYVTAAGQNRVMLIAVACEYSAAPGSQTLTVTYGGQSATQIVTNISQKNTVWLGYVNETKLTAAGSNTTLSVTNNNTTNLAGMYATAAVYAGVDQTTPTTGSASASTASATSLTLTAYNVSGKTGNNGMSVIVANWDGRTSTPSAGYTEEADYAGTNFNIASSFKLITASGTEAPVTTAASAAAGAFAGVGLNPDLKIATITTCSGCHGYNPIDGSARNTPDGQFTGSHNTHSGNGDLQYAYACTKCHYNAAANNHSTGYKNISGSAVAGSSYSQGKKIAVTSTPTFGTCNRATCHVTGRSNIQYSPSPTWGQQTTCLSCHAGRNGATGAISKSTAGYSLSTSHFQHLKYGANNVNCQTCHGKTATDAATLKNYTAVNYHVNGTAEVIFTNIAYASYTSYNRTSKTCRNTACHGGVTRNAWSNSGALNSDNTCVHCHGVAGTSSSSTDKKRFAPGWANTGISTDGRTVASDYRVGAHFVHLSSAYMTNIKCNECHTVPTSPFNGTHMAAPRYNSQTLSFSQASSATKNSTVPVKNDGTASSAASCTTTYCHGSNMPSGDTSGTARSVQWNQDTLMTRTPGADCSKCHGNPPTTGSSSSQHSGKTATTSCYGCHSTVVSSTGAIINKSLHINGSIDATGGHQFPYPGAIHNSAAGSPPYSGCSGGACHNTTATGGTYVSGSAPNCGYCHTVIANFNGSTPGCYDCHGSSSTNGSPNGGVAFPNWSGSHPTHVTRQGLSCATCHANGGTGNTAHGFSNDTVKTRTTVNVSGAFTYNSGNQSCSGVACHGNATWSVTQFDCIGCHTAANGAARAIVPELGSSSTYRSHHISGISPTKWHCIICHAEGDYSTGSTTTLHKNSTVELRNVDSPANPGNAGTNYWSIPATLTPAAAANLDTFCFRCHDAGGAAGIAMASATTLAALPPTTAQAQNPFQDTRTNSYDQYVRSVVMDVEGQFATTNKSHHAVRGRKYTSTGTQYLFNAGLFNTFNTLENSQVKDGSLLHCHDCHYLNGHGTANAEYMLQNSTGADVLASASGQVVCLKCHISTYDNNTAHTGGATSDFKYSAGLDTLANRTGSKNHYTGISCSGCHGGKTGFGGLHGMTAQTYTDANATTQNTYRFMPGMANSGYTPSGWTGASRGTTCYTPSNTSWSGCTSHTTVGKATATPNAMARPLSY